MPLVPFHVDRLVGFAARVARGWMLAAGVEAIAVASLEEAAPVGTGCASVMCATAAGCMSTEYRWCTGSRERLPLGDSFTGGAPSTAGTEPPWDIATELELNRREGERHDANIR